MEDNSKRRSGGRGSAAEIAERRRAVADRYETSLSAEKIARELGVSAQTVLNDLDALGIPRRPRGPAPGAQSNRAAAGALERRRDLAARLYGQDRSAPQIAYMLGVSKTTILKDLAAAGVARRPAGRQPESPLPEERPSEYCGTWWRPRRSQVLRGWGRFHTMECMSHDPKRRDASRESVTARNLYRRVELERVKDERDLLETHDVAELCGVQVSTVTNHYVVSGKLYLDRSLTTAESTRRFSEDGRGRKLPEERHYVVAIRRRGHPGWVFRFSHYDEKAFFPIVQMLNRLAREQGRSA